MLIGVLYVECDGLSESFKSKAPGRERVLEFVQILISVNESSVNGEDAFYVFTFSVEVRANA